MCHETTCWVDCAKQTFANVAQLFDVLTIVCSPVDFVMYISNVLKQTFVECAVDADFISSIMQSSLVKPDNNNIRKVYNMCVSQMNKEYVIERTLYVLVCVNGMHLLKIIY